MDTDIVRKVFIRFLKDNGAFYSFISHFPDYGHFKRHIESKESLSILSTAFIWDRTPQGHDYWRAIDNKWMNLLLGLSKTWLKWPLRIDSDAVKKRTNYCQYKIEEDCNEAYWD